ncbi:MAG: lysophospholipid acyltransferase family protein [Gammaproteobacteria bacterium]|nr:lysophospholipid acyltransferase family protein [Gammaproteobacteria bacterium]
MELLRSLLFTSLLFLSIPPYALALLVVRPFGYDRAYRVVSAWVRLNLWLAEALCGLRYEIDGLERLPSVPSVALVKHSSAYETLLQPVIFPRQTWVLKRELMWAPFFGWALATMKPIAIDRSAGRSAVDQVISQGLARLAEGIWVAVFPEGTRMPPGETRRYGLSGTLLAQEAGCHIVPLAHDAGDYWPRRGWRKKAGTVRFVIGEPVNPAGRDVREVNAEIQDWIETTVAELRGDTA